MGQDRCQVNLDTEAKEKKSSLSNPSGCTHKLKFVALQSFETRLASSFWFQVQVLLMKPQISWRWSLWLGVQLRIREDSFIVAVAT